MTQKYNDLKTVKDITNIVTAENIDCLIGDFKMFLQFHIETRNFDCSKVPGLEGMALDEMKMGNVFRWCDDGEVGCTGINIEISNKII